jgi:hypothetical protein
VSSNAPVSDDHVPRNLAVTLRLLRVAAHHSSHSLPDELNGTPGRAVPGRDRRPAAKFNHDMISNIENGVSLKIWQLGRYANWCGIPPGTLLLLSQLASHLRDGTAEDIRLAKTLAHAARELCDYVIQNADKLASLNSDTLPDDDKGAAVADIVRKCAYQDASKEDEIRTARQILIVKELLDQYPEAAKGPYKEHANRRFRKSDTIR